MDTLSSFKDGIPLGNFRGLKTDRFPVRLEFIFCRASGEQGVLVCSNVLEFAYRSFPECAPSLFKPGANDALGPLAFDLLIVESGRLVKRWESTVGSEKVVCLLIDMEGAPCLEDLVDHPGVLVVCSHVEFGRPERSPEGTVGE